ncbi:MAG: acyl-CoA dehydratase activase, partial [Pseudomonadota bacterium]
MEQREWIVAGIDVGAATVKTVILNGDAIQSSAILPSGASVVKAAEAVMQEALKRSGLIMDNLGYVVSTGYGRRAVSFAHKALTEILCHARGVSSLHPGVRTVIDIGGQDSKVIAVDEQGRVTNFVMNDKCAAGTGRFLEVMAMILEVKIQEIGSLSLHAREPCKVTS